MQNMLSQIGAQGLGGPSIANPDGPGVAGPSGQGGGPSWQKTKNDFQQAWDVSEGYPSATYSDGEGASVALPLGAVAFGIDFLVNFFEDLFSGPNSPPIPRKLMHKRHPLYGEILGIDSGLIPTEGTSARGGATGAPSTPRALQKPVSETKIPGVNEPLPGYNYCGPGNNSPAPATNSTDLCCQAHDACYDQFGLSAANVPGFGKTGMVAGPLQRSCDQDLCQCVNISRGKRAIRFFGSIGHSRALLLLNG